MMKTGRHNLLSQVRLYMTGQMSESEQDLFFWDLDHDDGLRAAAWHTYEMLKSQERTSEQAAEDSSFPDSV